MYGWVVFYFIGISYEVKKFYAHLAKKRLIASQYRSDAKSSRTNSLFLDISSEKQMKIL